MQARGTPLKVFGNRAFAQYWLGSLVSRVGDHFGHLALAWLTLQRTGSPAAVGLVMATYPAAGLLTNLVAGHLHDRWPRRRLLLVDNLARGALFAAFPLLDQTGTPGLPVILGLIVAAGALAAISRVGEKVVLPNLVTDTDLEPANAVSQAVWQLAYLLRPALGGIATATLGAAPTLGLNGRHRTGRGGLHRRGVWVLAGTQPADTARTRSRHGRAGAGYQPHLTPHKGPGGSRAGSNAIDG
jgi:predicted MFS family arabinose efflux permease